MFSFPLLIILVSALVATGLTAVGLHLFFRLLERNTPTQRAVSSREQTPGGE